MYSIKSKKKEMVELSFLYFRFRNLFDYGFQKYNFFKNLISYVCNISDYRLIRRIFEDMYRRNIFTEKKIKGQGIYYLFNPFNREYKEEIKETIIWH